MPYYLHLHGRTQVLFYLVERIDWNRGRGIYSHDGLYSGITSLFYAFRHNPMGEFVVDYLEIMDYFLFKRVICISRTPNHV